MAENCEIPETWVNNLVEAQHQLLQLNLDSLEHVVLKHQLDVLLLVVVINLNVRAALGVKQNGCKNEDLKASNIFTTI